MKKAQILLINEVKLHGKRVLNKIAYESGVSIATIEQIHRGTYKHTMNFTNAINLARALGVNVNELVDDEVNEVA